MGENVVNVRTAEMAVGANDLMIKTGSVGSCVVITLFDSAAKVGGLAHAMLPTRRKTDRDGEGEDISAKYADEAVDALIAEIEKNGGSKRNLIAKLVGGAKMFSRLSSEKHNIGFQNVESAKARLLEHGIQVEGEDTGGSTGKLVEMNLANGIVEVHTKL